VQITVAVEPDEKNRALRIEADGELRASGRSTWVERCERNGGTGTGGQRRRSAVIDRSRPVGNLLFGH
jgi:hypothetical protein